MDENRSLDKLYTFLYKSQTSWEIRTVATISFLLVTFIGYFIVIRNPIKDTGVTMNGVFLILINLSIQLIFTFIFLYFNRLYKEGRLKYTNFKTLITQLGEIKRKYVFISMAITVSWHLILLGRYVFKL